MKQHTAADAPTGSRNFALRSDGFRVVECMVKNGDLAALRCVEEQVGGCYCPAAQNALAGATQALEEPHHVRADADKAEVVMRAKGLAQLVELRARSEGFLRQPPEKRFAGPALSVQQERLRRRGQVEAGAVEKPRPSKRPPCSTPGCRLFAVRDGFCGPDAAEKYARESRAARKSENYAPPPEESTPAVVRVRPEAVASRAAVLRVEGRIEDAERIEALSRSKPKAKTTSVYREPCDWTCPKCERQRRGGAKWNHPGYDEGRTQICGTCRYSLLQAATPNEELSVGALRARIATMEAELAEAKKKGAPADLADVLRGICLMVLDRLGPGDK